jgi:riboflavin kinase/FMN adenylyltransferase
VFDNSTLTTEVFILDFEGDLYNKALDILFIDFIRPQIKYENWNLLKEQIEKDVVAVRAI